jgi:hypothetical protein
MQLPQLMQRRDVTGSLVFLRSREAVWSGISNPPQRGQDSPDGANCLLRWSLFRSGTSGNPSNRIIASFRSVGRTARSFPGPS